jgi:hypothetical protein
MSYQRQLEREEEALERELESGRIDLHEYTKAMRDLHHDYRESAYESAREAYERELDRW